LGIAVLVSLGVLTFWGLLILGRRLMATLAEVNASIAAQTQAIQELEAAMPGPPAATEDDLENVNKSIEDNTAEIRRITAESPGGGKP
jgi:type II secretory pathway component PulM